MTDNDESGIVEEEVQPVMVECCWSYTYTTSDGRIVNRMLKFFVTEKQYEQFDNQAAVLGDL